ncbi:MAG TPA: hypothetical protein HPP57_04235 [Deltaproteobacteria bacterium]|jgi:hypothetical protein|nr:hypothetical protein [Deltaproteobacteria bacterium]
MEASDIVEKLSRLILKWIRLAWVWVLKFVKIRIVKFRFRKAQRNLSQRRSRLGAEFYSLHRQGETEFLKSLVVLQQLKIVEEAESRVFAVHDRIKAIEKEYHGKKEAIREGSAKGRAIF